jgi:hypothetical protein
VLDGVPQHRYLFGKNSDREPNEAHLGVRIPAADHPPDSQVACTSLFKPVWVDVALPDIGAPTGTYNAATLYWRYEALHRATLRNYDALIRLYQRERDTLEASLVDRSPAAAEHSAAERVALATRCFAEAYAAEARWLERIANAEVEKRRRWLHTLAWEQFNQQAERLLDA